jgi:hypothetical protein
MLKVCLFLLLSIIRQDHQLSFVSSFSSNNYNNNNNPLNNIHRIQTSSSTSLYGTFLDKDEWKGDVVPGGTIRGCSLTQVGDSLTDWIIKIDGIEADLGRFSDAIWKQILANAKKERFQGFRPGTIPPQVMPTYTAYCMDEVAREAVLEAMQQNNIRPFSDARSQFVIEQISFLPAQPKKKKPSKKKNNKKKKNEQSDSDIDDNVHQDEEEASEEPEPKWLYFDTMEEAIKGGWKPGQTFSFVASNVKGQNIIPDKNMEGAAPLGTRRVE